MSWFFDGSAPVLTAKDLVIAFTNKRPEELHLPKRAVIVFTPADLSALAGRTGAAPVAAWLPFRRFYKTAGGGTVLARSAVGGPALAALVEELAAFGAEEFCLWGYCGGIGGGVRPGDVVLATEAVRERASAHYLESADRVSRRRRRASGARRRMKRGFARGACGPPTRSTGRRRTRSQGMRKKA